jgi:MYXO-CTERM domain-containing protein
VRTALCLFLVGAAAVSTVQADSLSFQGTFSTDDQVQLFDFTLLSTATVTLQSFGYAGGTNQADTVIPPGGFDSYFTWFDSAGNQIGTDDDGLDNLGCVGVGKHNGACLDAFAQPTLTAGSYTLALTVSGNDPNGSLSDGFSQQGQGDFTANGPCLDFCDAFGNQDSGNWAVDIVNVSSASNSGTAPEPATMLLAGGGLVLIGLARRRRPAEKRKIGDRV